MHDLLIGARILRILNMQQIGRNYYSPSDPLSIPQHKYLHFLCLCWGGRGSCQPRWLVIEDKKNSVYYTEYKLNKTGLT